jgi:hypothetical protein
MRQTALAVAFLLLSSSNTFSAENTEKSWRLGGGAAIPVSPDRFKDVHSFGFDFHVGLGVKLARGFHVLAVYDLCRLFVDENGVTDYIESIDPTLSPGDPVDSSPTNVHTAMVLAVVPLTSSDSARPTVIGGVGWMWLQQGTISYSGGDLGGGNESAPAVTIGVGVEFEIDYNLRAFVEAAWMVGFTDDQSTQWVPVRFGVCR